MKIFYVTFYLLTFALNVLLGLKFKSSEDLSCTWNQDCSKMKLCKNLIDSHCLCLHGQCEVIDNIPAETEKCGEYKDCKCRYAKHYLKEWILLQLTITLFLISTRKNKTSCFCHSGVCLKKRFECHEDDCCDKLEKCAGGNCVCSGKSSFKINSNKREVFPVSWVSINHNHFS